MIDLYLWMKDNGSLETVIQGEESPVSKKQICCLAVCLSLMLVASASLADGDRIASKTNTIDYTQLDLEELFNIRVTSVSKKPEKLSETASAIYVITQDDIKRIGATTIMEALRGVPGLCVGRINSSTWAIGARGFNGEFAGKMLVMIDGISIYDPMFSGVFWMNHDMVMQDIDRIEVIRGPGATVWGANAVNGVINIITKSATYTEGFLASATLGTEDRNLNSLQFGGRLNRDSYYRVYGMYNSRGAQVDSLGRSSQDSWVSNRAGFRVDIDKSERTSTTFLGDIANVNAKQNVTVASLTPPYSYPYLDDARFKISNLLARWNYNDTTGSDNTLQFYYTRAEHLSIAGNDECNTWDFDFQRHTAYLGKHDIVWGLDYRIIADHIKEGVLFLANPDHNKSSLFSAFLQDDITLSCDKLRLILGSKIENNSYTGLEIQPSARVLWTPDARHTAWGSISHAVRTPARKDTGFVTKTGVFLSTGGFFPQDSLVLMTIEGVPAIESEDLVAYEAGYRMQPSDNLSFDVTAFYNKYTNLVAYEFGAPYFVTSPEPAHYVWPMYFINGEHGKSSGIEITSSWDITNRWRLKMGFSTLRMTLVSPGDIHQGNGVNPRRQAYLRSSFDLGSNTELDVVVNRVGSISSSAFFGTATIPAYTRVDLSFGWRRSPSQELRFVVQNLTSSHHPEMFAMWAGATEVQRGCYLNMVWQY